MQKNEYDNWVAEEKKRLMLHSSGWFLQANVLMSIFLLFHCGLQNMFSHPVIIMNIICALITAMFIRYLIPLSISRAWQALIFSVFILTCSWNVVFYHLLKVDDAVVVFPLVILLLFTSLITLYLSPPLFNMLAFSLTIMATAGSIILDNANLFLCVMAGIFILLTVISAKKIMDQRFTYAIEREHENTLLIERFSKLASKDSLTGLFNRRYFKNYLKSVFPRNNDTLRKLSVLLIDVDFFKNYNDCRGHQAGDECLIAVADCLMACTRRTQDLVARYGGEEFIILLPGSDSEQALAVAARVRGKIAARAIFHGASAVSPTVTVSQGIAEWRPGVDRKQLIENADLALYQAKAQGRNGYILYQPGL
jgi:diguanylate cyclase (GGDEF)-like protein